MIVPKLTPGISGREWFPNSKPSRAFWGADLLRRDLPDAVEFTVLTIWESMDAIQAFAGIDPAMAVVEPGAIAALRDFDDRVSHHDLLETVGVAATCSNPIGRTD